MWNVNDLNKKMTSLPYFGVKFSCVCLMFAYRKKVMTYSDPKVTYSYPRVTYGDARVTHSYPRVTYNDPKVTYSDPKVTHSDPTHLPLPLPASPGSLQAISQV